MKKITSILLSMVMVMTVITIVPVVWGGGVFAAEPTVHWVTTNENSGTGSLRAAIEAANDGDTIKFADKFFTENGGVDTENHVITVPITISPESTLEISKAITIEGRTIGENDNDFEVGSPAVIIKGKGTYNPSSITAEENTDFNTRITEAADDPVELAKIAREKDLLELERTDVTKALGGSNLRLINVATLDHESTLSISNVIFTMAKNNAVGAAIATTDGTVEQQYLLSLNNCRFERNEAAGVAGGAISIGKAVSLKMDKCEFIKNSSTSASGGTIVLSTTSDAGAFNVDNSRFVENYSGNGDTKNGEGGGITRINGGPIAEASLMSGVVSSYYKNCDFIGNSTRSNGGTFALRNTGPRFIDCKFERNSATLNGGALAGSNGTMASDMVQNCTFINNTAGSSGGAMGFTKPSFSVKDSTFIGNTAGANGGAVHVTATSTFSGCGFRDNTAGANGGALSSTANLLIDSCSFIRNKSENTTPGADTVNGYVGGSAVYKSASSQNPIILNSTFYGNENAEEYDKNVGVILYERSSASGSAEINMYNCTIANNATHDRSAVAIVAPYHDSATTPKFSIFNSIITNGTETSAPQLLGVRALESSPTIDEPTHWETVNEIDNANAVNIISVANGDGNGVTNSYDSIFGANPLIDDKYILPITDAPADPDVTAGVVIADTDITHNLADTVTYYNAINGTSHSTSNNTSKKATTNWALSTDQLGVRRFDFTDNGANSFTYGGNPVNPILLGAVMLPDDSYGMIEKDVDVYTAQFAVAEAALADYTNIALMLTTHNGDGALTSAQVITDSVIRTAYGGFAVFTADVQKANPNDTVTAVVWDMDSNEPIAQAVNGETLEVAPALQHILSTSVRAEPEEPGEPGEPEE